MIFKVIASVLLFHFNFSALCDKNNLSNNLIKKLFFIDLWRGCFVFVLFVVNLRGGKQKEVESDTTTDQQQQHAPLPQLLTFGGTFLLNIAF